ncbi:putative MT-associated protein TORTIFOLIA1/SPIRAL2 [Helianthus annuus]|nr:putative MT-associated protein TORTIFOLIA1/SPIRAL2 [Helianthus annuus]
MPPPKPTSTHHSPPQNFKHQVLTCLHKLSDRDTHSAAATELETIAKHLTNESIPSFLSSITTTNSSDKSPVRKQCIHLISTLSEAHGDILSPFLHKLISAITRRLRDPDTVVRTACVAASGSLACHVTKPPFVSVVKPFVDALVTEQDVNAQTGAALCMAAVINHAREPDTEYLTRLLPRIERLLKSDSFKGKAALLSVVGSMISVGAGSSAISVMNLVKITTDFVAKSEDWCVRKAAAEVLEKLAVVEKDLLRESKASCLKIFEAKKFDKVKSVRETMNRMIEAWNAIPDVPGSHSSKGDTAEESDHIQNPPKTPYIMSKRTTTRRNSLENSSRKTGPAMFSKLDRKKPVNQKLDTAEVHMKHETKPHMKHETKPALFSEISDEKMLESRYNEDKSSSKVLGSNGELNTNSVEQESEDLSLIRNQLAQIETQQSNLYDLLEKFIGSSLSGMQSLESRVRSVESTLDEISFDLAKSTGHVSNPEPTLCCKLPGADLISSKLWKKSEIQQYPSVKNKDLESFNFQTTGFHLRAGLIKNPLAKVRQI